MLYGLYSDHQRAFIPERENLLLTNPIPLFLYEFEVESEDDLSEDETHFRVCKTSKTIISARGSFGLS